MENKKRPLTVAALFGYLHDNYNRNIWRGVRDAARDMDVNIFYYTRIGLESGKYLDIIRRLKTMIDQNRIRGIIGLTGSMAFTGHIDIQELYSHFSSFPILSLSERIDNGHNILIDNYLGMKLVVTHLINEHGIKKMAYIAGPSGLIESNQRFNAYKDVLEQKGFPLDKDLVVECPISGERVRDAIKQLLDQKKKSFEAVVCMNDYIAHLTVEELKIRGIRVPDDVIVTGFDNSEVWSASKPLLTTVHQPLYTMGYQALVSLVKIIQGINVPKDQLYEPVFLIKDSCGCKDGNQSLVQDEEYKKPLELRITSILKKTIEIPCTQKVWDKYSKNIIQAWQDLNQKPGVKQEKALCSSLLNIYKPSIALYSWNSILGWIFTVLVEKVEDKKISPDVHFAWNRIVSFIIEKEESRLILNNNKLESQIYSFSHFGGRLYEKFDFDAKVIKVFLKDYNIEHCLIFLYCGHDEAHYYDQVFLFSGFSKEKIFDNPKPKIFPSSQLVPKNIVKIEKGQFLILPIFGENKDIGFCVVDALEIHASVYEMLTEIMSVSIRGQDLTKKLNQHTLRLEETIRETTLELFEKSCDNHRITPREREILLLLLQGLLNKEIASLCSIAQRTAEFHIQHIFSKFNVNNRMELINKLQLMGIRTTELGD